MQAIEPRVDSSPLSLKNCKIADSIRPRIRSRPQKQFHEQMIVTRDSESGGIAFA
jgi:hypothetical protein